MRVEPSYGGAAQGGAAAAKIRGESFNLNDAMQKYGEEVSPEKRGARWELLSVDAITTKHPHWPGKRRMAELDGPDLIPWCVLDCPACATAELV